jgi:putative DNA primase/helicase
MERAEFETRVKAVKEHASNRWRDILQTLGIPNEILRGKDCACPMCGGGKRVFRFDDRYGNGDYYCHGCGNGDGFRLLQCITGWNFMEALKAVERQVGSLPRDAISKTKRERSPEQTRELLNKTWDEASIVQPSDPVARYLARRGLVMRKFPMALRYHPELAYFERDGKTSRMIGVFPAMVAKVRDLSGKPVTLHRTYLNSTMVSKATVESPKKLMTSGINGAAIHLCEAGETLALAEGIETALAVHQLDGLPVWATIDAGNMERVLLPETVRKVYIYADHDASYTGQRAAYVLAHRLVVIEKRQVEVRIPEQPGDWLDALLANRRKAA